MEVLYDNLENYDDFNAVTELRKENEELKLKLEEYSAAMENLQKDYDKLEHSFHVLEKNYSSLLLTAREEVKRKSEQISQLNKDKDMMIINSLQNNKGKGFNNPKKCKKRNKSQVNKNKIDKPVQKDVTQQDINKNSVVKEQHMDYQDKAELKLGRADVPRSSAPTRTNIVDALATDDHYQKENIGATQFRPQYIDEPKPPARSIKDRRKSMPVKESMEIDKYKIDEDKDLHQPFKATTRNEADRFDRRHLDRVASDRHSNKNSETSSLEDRNINYQESRDNRNRPGRYEADTYRGRDKYYNDCYKNRDKQHSPERPHRKPPSDYRDVKDRLEPHSPERSHRKPPSDYRDVKDRAEPHSPGRSHRKPPSDYRDVKDRAEPHSPGRSHRKPPSDYRDVKDRAEPHSPGRSHRKPPSDYRDVKDRAEPHSPGRSHRKPPSDYRDVKDRADSHSPGRSHRKPPSDYRDVKDRAEPHSPGRSHRRPTNEYHEDYRKQDRSRHRVLESPPPDSFNRQHRYDPRPNYEGHSNTPNYEGRSNIPNYEGHSRESELFRQNYEEIYAAKHKISMDHDGPQPKRQRIDTYDARERHYEQNKSYHTNRTGAEGYPVDHLQNYNKLDSCQSPDLSDVPYEHNIKEIRTTAAVQLEDPRKTSKKYVFKTDNGRTMLTTVTGRNIDVVPVDKCKWNMKKVDVPEALIRKPETSEELINDIYKDIENAETNSSPEPGEIYDDDSEDTGAISRNEYNTGNIIGPKEDINVKVKKMVAPQNMIKDNTKSIKDISKDFKSKCTKDTKIYNSSSVTCVPKASLDLPQIGSEQIKSSKSIERKDSSASLPQITTDGEFESDDTMQNVNWARKSSRKRQVIEEDTDSNPVASDDKTLDSENLENVRRTRASIALVEGDLELSDETSDFVDIKRKSTEKLNKIRNKKSVKETTENSGKPENNSSLPAKELNMNKVFSETKKAKVVDQAEEPNSSKIQKNKKKRNKSKETFSKESEATDVLKPHKTKTKKDKDDKPKQIKSKFTDLFGDSSSLITPEDLGIPVYEPVVLEDAQDAVDINIAKVKIQNLKEKHEEKNTTFFDEPNIKSKKSLVEVPVTEDKHISQDIIEATKEKISSINGLEMSHSSVPPNLVYDNLESETKTDNDIVTTVVISTGVQPQFAAENDDVVKRLTVETQPVTTVDYKQIPAIRDLKGTFTLNALATSTPYKEHTDAQISPVDIISSSNKSPPVGTAPDQGDTNTLDSQNDAPDVRIFVKRRRKGVKRPPMNVT